MAKLNLKTMKAKLRAAAHHRSKEALAPLELRYTLIEARARKIHKKARKAADAKYKATVVVPLKALSARQRVESVRLLKRLADIDSAFPDEVDG